MTKSVTLPAGAATLTAQGRYNIETDWDYAYVTVNGNPGPDEPVGQHEPERPEPRERASPATRHELGRR